MASCICGLTWELLCVGLSGTFYVWPYVENYMPGFGSVSFGGVDVPCSRLVHRLVVAVLPSCCPWLVILSLSRSLWFSVSPGYGFTTRTGVYWGRICLSSA